KLASRPRRSVTRRRVLRWGSAGAGVVGAAMLAPAPWRAAFGQAKPYKIGSLQPLSGSGAAGGKTALVGIQMAVDRINKSGGTNGIPLGTADMTPFLSKISGDFDGLLGIFFGQDGVTIGNQAYDLGMTRKYKWAGDGAIAESTNLAALGKKIEGFVGINRYV